MASTSELCRRLTLGSVRGVWSLDALPWVERLDPDAWALSPEWCSPFGTPVWDALDEPTRRRLSLTELCAFFSLTLHGERPLVAGLAARAFDGRHDAATSRYLYHFLEEEGRHIAMFGEFCLRYHRVYPWKKLALRPPDPEDDVRFYVKGLVVEELGLHYNALLAEDDRLPPIVREINAVHRRDELRHVAFGRQALAERVAALAPEALPGLRAWTSTYLRQSCEDLCNAAALADAGVPEPHEARAVVLASAPFRSRCAEASAGLVGSLRGLGLLAAA